ncbi:LysR family transcriptional regulator [Streptomyces sp. NPDC052107]|uniref:LysR family transcriptional regulator n=1 Tax=Streptomyces sp. NPDC052107 TaxID=3155632 RepID=UPI00341C4F1D
MRRAPQPQGARGVPCRRSGGFSPGKHGTAAARAELIVQSALSTSVRNLERELGADLFDRTGHRVVLTEAGRALLPQARALLAGAEAAGTRSRPWPDLPRAGCPWGRSRR